MRDKNKPRNIGPFWVKYRSFYGPYVLVDKNGIPYSRRVPIDQLKVVSVTPSTQAGDAEDVYEVQSILDERHEDKTGKHQYFIKWRHYSDKDNSWVDADKVSARDKIKEFKNRKKIATAIRQGHAGAVINIMQIVDTDSIIVINNTDDMNVEENENDDENDVSD